MDRPPTFGLPTRDTTRTSASEEQREPLLDRQPFGMSWRAPTWLILLWTAFVLVIGFGAYTDPLNGPTLGFGLLLLTGIWLAGLVPLGLLWVAAWYRRRRRGTAD